LAVKGAGVVAATQVTEVSVNVVGVVAPGAVI
jgi:hypothetical protein